MIIVETNYRLAGKYDKLLCIWPQRNQMMSKMHCSEKKKQLFSTLCDVAELHCGEDSN